MNNDIIIFTGPTLSLEDARKELDALYLPPASQGDVYSAARRRPWAIGIIDGYFERVPAVWHKELVWAMSEGVHLFGSASMGALRAAETERFGMVGVGAVFEAFKDGKLMDDDEVTVVHGDVGTGYQKLSEAMVNIRATLAKARDTDVIDGDAHDALITIAKNLFYPERTYKKILSLGEHQGSVRSACEALKDWLPSNKIDQKRDDALTMLRQIRHQAETGKGPKKVGYTFYNTALWQELCSRLADRPLDHAAGAATQQHDALIEELKLQGTPYLHQRERAMNRVLALELAEQYGVNVSLDAEKETLTEFRYERGLESPTDVEDWISHQQLTLRSFHHLIHDEARIRQVRQMGRSTLDMHLRDDLRVRGSYGELEKRSREKQRLLAERGQTSPRLADSGLSEEQLWEWYFEERLGRSVPEDLRAYAQSYDFADFDTFRRAVLREYYFFEVLSGTL